MMRLLLALSMSGRAAAAAAATKNRYGALRIVPEGLTPRYVADKSHGLAKRDGSCGEGNHSCLEIGHGDRCCDNDSYCYINKDGAPKCCAIGSNCSNDSPCGSTAFYYIVTRTLTLSSLSSSSSSVATTTQAGCCARACPQASHYLCPSSLGGNCCPYGADCQAGGNCIATVMPSASLSSSSSSPAARLTPAPEGCTTSQYKCADGTGCCANSQHCTQFAGTGFCADGGPTGTPVSVDGGGPPGLSVAAKAGIAIAAVVAAALVIGTVAWLFISRRRGGSLRTMSRESGGGSGNNNSPPRAARPMTTVTASSQAWPGRGDVWSEPSPNPGAEAVPVSSPAPERAVPGQLERPVDIAATPVEIGPGERAEGSEDELVTPRSPVTTATFAELQRTETTDGRFELPGSDVGWTQLSPLSPTSPNTY